MRDFDDYYILRNVGPNLWQAFNIATGKSASPRYTNADAAIHYVEQDLKQEMDTQMDQMLGGDGDITRVYDDSTFRCRLPNATTRDGTEEK